MFVINLQDEKYAHIDKKDVDLVIKKLEEKRKWNESKLNAQNQLAKHQNPVVLVQQIITELGVSFNRDTIEWDGCLYCYKPAK